LESLPLKSRSQTIYTTIRHEILHGQLAPAQELDLDVLAHRFGGSTTPVREAIANLAAESLVTSVEGGYCVAPVSLADCRSIYETRALIEGGIARLAAVRANDCDVADIAKELDNVRAAAREGKGADVLRGLKAFHFRIYEVLKNERLLEVLALLWDQSLRYRSVFLSNDIDDVVESHAAILEKLMARDADGCERAMARDIRITMNRVDARA
jgi:DNA-binding GntR family transcriptional regulator